MYKLTSENLTHLGGPMGSEYTTTNWTKYFIHKTNAKRYAEKDYGNQIEWKGNSSGDLSYVMYTITKIKVEDE